MDHYLWQNQSCLRVVQQPFLSDSLSFQAAVFSKSKMVCRLAFFISLLIVDTWKHAWAVPVLKQVHIITRHGARTPLPKNADTLLELAGSTLTPLGQKQLYDVGVWLRQVYNGNGFLEYYDASEVRLESSDLDRTLTSASALSLGLFPYRAQAANHGEELYESLLPEMPGLPIYSMKESNDFYFRAYHRNCPIYEDRLEALYESSQWKILESNNQGILKKLAALFPEDFDDGDTDESNNKISEGSVVMKHLWNYYDIIKVARTECIPNATVYSCTSMGPDVYNLKNALSHTEFQELESLMASSEAMKFGIATASNLLGSQLLWRMLNRTNDTSGKVFLYSAHAPTIFSFMSTLQEWSSDERHPDYGSAIIMEVYQESDSSQAQSIRFLYKAAKKTTATYIPMTKADCEQPFGGDAPPTTTGFSSDLTHCLMADFLVWATSNTIMRPEDWCDACGNESADVCLQAKLHNQDSSERGSEEFESAFDDDKEQAFIIAGTFFGGFFVGLMLMGTSCTICRRRATAKEEVSPTKTNDIKRSSSPTEIEAPGLNTEIN